VLLEIAVDGVLILADQLVTPRMTSVPSHLRMAEAHRQHVEALQGVTIGSRSFGVLHIEIQPINGGSG